VSLIAAPGASRAADAPASAQAATTAPSAAAATPPLTGTPTPANATEGAAHPPRAPQGRRLRTASAAARSERPTDASARQTSEAIRISLILTLLALLPSVAICMTPFVRIVVVLSMIRHAFGMPETPPNAVLVSLALFLTAFVMMPTLTQVNSRALQPFLDGAISVRTGIDRGSGPMREFMLRQVKDKDIQTIYEISRQPLPTRAADVGLMPLTSAFMLNELRVSFKIGFVVLLPFLLIDLVVSSVLLSLGILMVPPSTLSLPIKVLMFVLIDGWSLVLEGVVGSFR
jgi:flagellar biosynthetic protein FliP